MAGRNELDPFGLGLWKIWILQLAASGIPAVHTLSELGELGGRPGIDTTLLCHYLSRVHGWVSASFSPLILNYG